MDESLQLAGCFNCFAREREILTAREVEALLLSAAGGSDVGMESNYGTSAAAGSSQLSKQLRRAVKEERLQGAP